MVAVWTQTLMSAAEISNFFSALGVVVCFLCMVVFILRVQGVQMAASSVVHIGQPPAVQVKYQKVGVPFTFSLLNSKDVPPDELKLKVTSYVSCCFQAFWCVPALQLKNLLYLSWSEFADTLENDKKLEAERIEPVRYLEPTEDKTHTISLVVAPNLSSLGKPPRSHFPLIVFLKRREVPSDEGSDVGALILIIHISDDDCPMPTTILYHYMKQYSGQLTQLQSLYTQRADPTLKEAQFPRSPNNEYNNIDESFDGEINEEGACVICRVMQPTRALLPCRHVCVCSSCFPHLDTCPLCRCRISAFFLTDPKEEERQYQLNQNETKNTDVNLVRHRSFLNNMNGVLNSLLGIRAVEG